VLYVFRVMVDDDIPMNAGCLRPIKIIIPQKSLLSPEFPAAVVAGNVETSQAVTDCLFGALGALAAAQGTMNNLTFGNARYQYYETICSGSPAGPGFDGTDAVHTHMTNSRLTDPEVLEWRFPVLVESFAIRRSVRAPSPLVPERPSSRSTAVRFAGSTARTGINPSTSGNAFRITSTQSGARTAQLVWRVSF
jgi:N-methylhydantoinase B/oxoprolinase/acetone carboxylase alpha subunit